MVHCGPSIGLMEIQLRFHQHGNDSRSHARSGPRHSDPHVRPAPDAQICMHARPRRTRIHRRHDLCFLIIYTYIHTYIPSHTETNQTKPIVVYVCVPGVTNNSSISINSLLLLLLGYIHQFPGFAQWCSLDHTEGSGGEEAEKEKKLWREELEGAAHTRRERERETVGERERERGRERVGEDLSVREREE